MTENRMLVGRAVFLLMVVGLCSATDESCLRYGGGSCCPVLNTIDSGSVSVEGAQNQPQYLVFLPQNEVSCTIDNICHTLFPLPDDSQTSLLYISTVYNDGSNLITSYIQFVPENGVQRLGNGQCQITDTTFAEVDCQSISFMLNHRCILNGDCVIKTYTDSISEVYGFSEQRQPISRACMNNAMGAISNNGLPTDNYHILPMRLPSRCVLNQVCSVAPVLQRFCQTVGVAFPSVNRCATPYGVSPF